MDTVKKLKNSSDDNQDSRRNRKMADQEENIESVKLRTIFPEEIWMLIFEDVFRLDDFFNLQKSSSFFRKLLKNQNTSILFPEVIKILASKSSKNNMLMYEPGANGKIPKHFLNCRLVCRTWQIGVDTAFQNFNHSSNLLDLALHQNVSNLSPENAHFSLPQQPLTFLQQFDRENATKSRNPFIGRNLYVHIWDVLITDMDSFTEQLLEILALYGHHIWSFSLSLMFTEQPLEPSNVWYYERLRDFLQLMPNLKALKLSAAGGYTVDNWEDLRFSLSSCVFPELKDLAYLQVSNLPTPLFDALIRRYSHVNMLSSHTLLGTSDILMYTHNFPNLTQIAISLGHINQLIQWDTSVPLWPLKTLIIRLEVYSMPVDWQSLFHFLENRWSATLTELKIDFFHVRLYDSYSTQVLPPLKLSKLKVFAFKSNILAPLDFALPMRNSLESLVVGYFPTLRRPELEPEFEIEKNVQFFKYGRNLESSNIWSLFPNLNTAKYYNWDSELLCRRPLSMV